MNTWVKEEGLLAEVILYIWFWDFNVTFNLKNREEKWLSYLINYNLPYTGAYFDICFTKLFRPGKCMLTECGRLLLKTSYYLFCHELFCIHLKFFFYSQVLVPCFVEYYLLYWTIPHRNFWNFSQLTWLFPLKSFPMLWDVRQHRDW